MSYDEQGGNKSENEGVKETEGSVKKKTTTTPCVGMRSFAYPYDAKGFVHFLECMRYIGSTDFPDENEYDSYMSVLGGSSNMYTEAEHARRGLHSFLKAKKHKDDDKLKNKNKRPRILYEEFDIKSGSSTKGSDKGEH